MRPIGYEPHSLKEKRLPFIFHFDTISQIYESKASDGGIEQLNYRQHCIQNWHENAEFLYITEGSGYLYCNSEKIKISTGDVVIINSFDLHYTETSGEMKYYCLIPDRAYLQQNGLNTSVIKFERLVKDNKAKELFEKIVSEYESENSFKEAGIKASVNDFVLYLARNYRVTPEKGKDAKTLHYMRMAIGYIGSRLSEKITADDVAKEIGLSKYYFLREFKKITNMTLVEYINGLRCEKARAMLREDNMSIGEISALCGFENGSYFNKIFRNETGVSMSEYRKNNKKDI